MPPMDEPQRIAIETEAGWLRIRDNVERGMNASMEMRLALLPGGKDGEASRRVRKEVEARMDKIKAAMWETAAHNLRVNGHDYDKFVQATEPFDEVLDRNLWALNAERVEWEIIVSDQRKQRPSQLLELERDIERRREHAEWLPEGEDDDETTAKKAAEIPRPPRHAETVKTFEQVAENMAELGKTVPVQLARAQRAQTVREEIANMPQ